MELQKSTNRLVELIRHSQSPYHTMKEAISQLEKAGFERISLAESAALEPGKAYYVSIYDRSLAAFRVPQSGFKGFRIITSHIDNPCFMIKPNPERKKSDCITLNVERYGGPILNTWLDRPLTIAGRVCVATDDPFNPKTMLYNSKKPVAVIPNLAIHMNRDANSGIKYNPQKDMIPLFGEISAKNKFEKIFVNNDKNYNHLKNLIKPFMLRRTKKEVIDELPEKIEQKFYVEMEKEHKRAYKSFVNLIKRRILENDEDNMTVFSYLTKLRQLSIAPEIIVKNYKGKNSKLEILMNIINSQKDRKILVFSQFTKVLKLIEDRLKEENINYSYLDGKTEAKERIKLVDDFNKSNDKKVFLISLKAGGTGLNLTSASMVIHFDPWFNPAVENQASDRAHRIGQKNVVDVIKLISKDTVEEKVIAMQESKKELIEDIINSNLENSTSLKKLSREDIIDLFENMD